MTEIKPPKLLELTRGKSTYHTFGDIKNGKGWPYVSKVSPCICEYNLDFVVGCVANSNPYIWTPAEVASGEILTKPRDAILGRLDQTLEAAASKLNPKLNPEIRYTKYFPESLKERIWRIIEEQVTEYKESRSEADLSRFFKDGFISDGRKNGCTYCYAKKVNGRQAIFVDDIDSSGLESQLRAISEDSEAIADGVIKTDENKKLRITVRVGKNTEGASIFHLNPLLKFLELCDRYGEELRERNTKFSGISAHIPTKFLYFDKKIAELLVKTQSSLGYSLAYEDLERGTMLFGFDNEYRMECAKRYAEAGVSTMLRVSHDCSVSFERAQEMGAHIFEIRDFLLSNPSVKGQLIPIRLQGQSDMMAITGKSRDELKHEGNLDLFKNNQSEGGHKPRMNVESVPSGIHDDYRKLFTEGSHLHVCADLGNTFYCDSCRIPGLLKAKIPHKRLIAVKKSKPEEHSRRQTSFI